MSDDTVKVPKEIINRLQACLIELEAVVKAAEGSQTEKRDTPKPASEETVIYNKFAKMYKDL